MPAGRRMRVAICLALALTAAGGLSACGDDGPSSDEIAEIKREARREALAEARSRAAEEETRRLRREVEELKRRSGAGSSDGSGSSTASTATSGSTSCGDGLSVNSRTSCPFARNVKDTYEGSGGASTIDVYSPVTGQSYRMTCTSGLPVVCTGGNGAAVYIR